MSKDLSMHRHFALGAIAVVLASGSAAAQSTLPPSAKAVALAQRYLADAEAQKILDNEGPVVAQYMLSKIPEPSGGAAKADEVRQAMLDAANAAVASKVELFLQRSAVIYANIYSEKELADIVSFYDSPSGKAFVAKTSQAAGPMAEMIHGLGGEIQSDTRLRFCAKEPASCAAGTPGAAPKGR